MVNTSSNSEREKDVRSDSSGDPSGDLSGFSLRTSVGIYQSPDKFYNPAVVKIGTSHRQLPLPVIFVSVLIAEERAPAIWCAGTRGFHYQDNRFLS